MRVRRGRARRRGSAFFGLIALVAAAVAVAVVAPLLVRASLQDSIGRATPAGTLAVVIAQQSGGGVPGNKPEDLLPDRTRWRIGSPILVVGQQTDWKQAGGTRAFVGGIAASTSCSATTIVSGACPSAPDEVALPDVGVAVGRSITLTKSPEPLKVVGLYRRGSDGGPFTAPAVVAAERVDGARADGADLLLSTSGLQRLQLPSVTTQAVTLVRSQRLEDVAAIRKQIAHLDEYTAFNQDTRITKPILDVLDRQEVATQAGALIAIALVLQALAVAWAAEAVFVSALGRSRAIEWGVARLRGFRLRRRLAWVFAEPLAATLIGGVVGYLLATAVAGLVSGGFATVQPAEPIPLLAAVAAVGGSAVALLLASVRSATVPLEQLLRQRLDPARVSRAALAAQVGVLVATALVVVSAVTGSSLAGSQLPLLAPALIAVSTGLIGLRIAVALLRGRGRGLPRTAFGLLVVRRLARSSSLLTPAVVVCVATAVAVAALQVAIVSDRTSQASASATVGADRVLTVKTGDGVDLLAAVRKADPTGRKAMAVVLAGSDPQLTAVDSARLGAVSAWDVRWSGRSAAALHRALAPATAASVRLTGTTLRVDLADVQAIADTRAAAVDPEDLRLQAVVDDGTAWRTIALGALDRSALTASIPCAGGCRLVSLQVRNVRPASPWRIAFTISGLQTDRQDASTLAAVLRADRWRQDIVPDTGQTGVPGVRITTVSSRLRIELRDDQPAAIPAVAPRDGLQPLPALIGPRSNQQGVEDVQGSYYGVGAALETIHIRPIGRASALPRSLGTGQLVDLAELGRVSDLGAADAVKQVWLGPAATAATVRALTAAGLQVAGDQRLGATLDADRHDVVPVVTRQGAAIGLGVLVLALAVVPAVELLRRRSLRARARAWTDSAGTRRSAAWLAFAGIALPAAAGVLLGIAAGAIAVATIIRLLPLAPGSTVSLPVDTALAWPAVVLPVAVAAVLLPVLGAVATRFGVRR